MLAAEWLGSADIQAEDQSGRVDMNTLRISQKEYDDKISRVKSEYLKVW